MQQTLINLKQRIDKNYEKIQRKNVFTKPILEMINNLINSNSSNEEIYQWLQQYDNTIFGIEYYLDIIEQNKL